MKLGTPPFTESVTDKNGVITLHWAEFIGNVQRLLGGLVESGTTAQRPTKNLYTGRMYFDTTLGLPIWYKTASWVKADGTAA